MTNEELNARLHVCAEAGMPYSDKLWSMLANAWDLGYARGHGDGSADAKGWARRHVSNPYREPPTRDELIDAASRSER